MLQEYPFVRISNQPSAMTTGFSYVFATFCRGMFRSGTFTFEVQFLLDSNY